VQEAASAPVVAAAPPETAAPTKPRAQLASAAPRACIGVIAGVRRTQECL
jgi:pilus assembly protein CpaB